MIKHEVRCVLDGRTIHQDDDGHEKKDPTRPLAKRQALDNLMAKKAPDGEGAWAFVQKPQSFRHNNIAMAAPSGPVWDDSWDARLEMFIPEKEARARDAEERVREGNPTQGGLAKDRARAAAAEAQNPPDDAAAKKAKAAAAKKAKDEAKKASEGGGGEG